MNLKKGSLVPGFLLIEALIGLLVALILSAVMVFYQGKSAIIRANTLKKGQALACACATFEGLIEGDTAPTDTKGYVIEKTTLAPVPMPTFQGIELRMPTMAPPLQVGVTYEGDGKPETFVLTSWIPT